MVTPRWPPKFWVGFRNKTIDARSIFSFLFRDQCPNPTSDSGFVGSEPKGLIHSSHNTPHTTHKRMNKLFNQERYINTKNSAHIIDISSGITIIVIIIVVNVAVVITFCVIVDGFVILLLLLLLTPLLFVILIKVIVTIAIIIKLKEILIRLNIFPMVLKPQ